MLVPALATLALAAAAQDTSDAFRDAQARALVREARARRATVDHAIERYRAEVQERISAGLRVVGSERLVFRRESAARIDWSREGPVHIEVTGAREVLPPILEGPQVPFDLTSYIGHLAFDPVGGEVFLPLDSEDIVHPLAQGGEALYRYASGDTTTIRLADGGSVRLVELRVEPRRADPSLIAGSFWFDAVTADLVRMVFRPAAARPFGGGLLSVDARVSLDRVTIEYGLWDLTWWMPRLIWAEGTVEFGSLASVPLSYERAYRNYVVEGDTARRGVAADSTGRPCRPRFDLVLGVGDRDDRAPPEEAPADSTVVPCGRRFVVSIPTDSAALIRSPELPGSVWAAGTALVTPGERAAAAVAGLPEPPWGIGRVRFAVPIGQLRYNRAEGFSPSVEAALDLGRAEVETRLRMGTADRRLRGDVGLVRRIEAGHLALRAYRRLGVVEPELQPLTPGSLFGALTFGNDDGDYYGTRGVLAEVLHRGRVGVDARLFLERQTALEAATDFSIRGLFDEEFAFRPMIEADPATELGLAARLDRVGGLDPLGLQWGVVLDLEAATGTFDYVRPSVLGRVTFPAVGLMGLLEGSVGMAGGNPPLQREWLLGGLPFVRGYDAAQLGGDAFWRARGEIGLPGPALRVVAFTDRGWAGRRETFPGGRPLASAGLGLTALDGLFRLDIARAFRTPTAWAVHFRFNAPL